LRNEHRTLKGELDSGELARPALAGPVPSPRASAGRWPLIAGLAVVAVFAVIAALRQLGTTGEAPPLELQHLRLTSTPGIEREPTLSPDGMWFLFVSDAAGNSDIYLQSASGQTQINLTRDSPAADAQPMFSPDGESVAFWSARDGGGLYVMGRTGEAPRRVASEGFDPAWSPDGRRLAYATGTTSVATNRGALSQLRTVDIASGQVTAVTEQDAMHPAWSPDGRFIAYWGLGRTIDNDEPISIRDLWVAPAGGGRSWRVTDDVHVNWCPQWNADGSFLYYVSNRGGSMNLWRLPMNPATGRPVGAPQALTTPAGYVGRARLSSSGEHVVYEARARTSNIHRASFDASRAAIGPVEAVTSGSRNFSFVDPSPDGRRLVLGTGFLHEEDLYISDADGSHLRQLTTDRFNDRHPVWSADGRDIAFYSDRSGKYEVWVTTPAGQLRQITDAPGFLPHFPRWSPDGSRMAVTDIRNRSAVVVFDPRAPWRSQTLDVLPPPAGPDSYLVGNSLAWSPDSTRLAGTVDDVVTIYDIAGRQYRPVDEVRGVVYAWLRDGRLLVGPATAPQLVDPDTGAIRPVAMPSFGDEAPGALKLSDDERLVYFALSRDDADIWLVTLVQK
jgi:tricorn protease